MGNAHLRLLAVWVSLSALFITSSLAAASSDGDVYCILRPNFPYIDAYLSPEYSGAPAYPFSETVGRYICTDPIPRSHLSRGANIRIVVPGSGESLFVPARFAHYDLDGVVVTRTAYVVPDSNSAAVVYVARGAGYIVIDENVPKSVVQTYSDISGDVAFLNPDPVLRMYIRAENGKMDIKYYSIAGVGAVPDTEVSIHFASCSLRVEDFSSALTEMEGKRYITGRFRILDGDDPVLIPGISVRVGDQIISPQYSSADMYYSFFAPYSENVETVVISADVSGCSHFEHEEYLSLHESSGWAGWILAGLIILAVLGVYILKKRR